MDGLVREYLEMVKDGKFKPTLTEEQLQKTLRKLYSGQGLFKHLCSCAREYGTDNELRDIEMFVGATLLFIWYGCCNDFTEGEMHGFLRDAYGAFIPGFKESLKENP